MPSVGMRRSTRVFVPKSVVKDNYGERVLRSGRRILWSDSESGNVKTGRGSVDGDEWFQLLHSSSDSAAAAIVDDRFCKDDVVWHEAVPKQEQEMAVIDFDREKVLQERLDNISGAALDDEKSADAFYGIVYHRKRRRLISNDLLSSDQSNARVSDDRMFGISFIRKQRRKKRTAAVSCSTEFLSETDISEGRNRECQVVLEKNLAFEVGNLGQDDSLGFDRQALIIVVDGSSCSSSNSFWLTCFLNSILSYMMRSGIRLPELAAFMCSKPIGPVFSEHGIHFFYVSGEESS